VDKPLTVAEAAGRAGVSDSLVYEWCGEGLLAHYRLGRKGKGGRVMIEEADLDAFLASCRREDRPPTPALPPLAHIKLKARHG
jgi:excisionase family DNA binding protein